MGFMQSLKRFEPYFAPRFKLPLHLVQLVLVTGVVGVAAYRMLMKGAPKGRSNSIGLGMGAKSLIIILYQLLTEHVGAFKKWASLKAFAILNVLEIVFWGAVAFLTFRSNNSSCNGTSCTLGWVIVALAAILNMLAQYVAVISVVDYRRFRRTRASNASGASPEEVRLKPADAREREQESDSSAQGYGYNRV